MLSKCVFFFRHCTSNIIYVNFITVTGLSYYIFWHESKCQNNFEFTVHSNNDEMITTNSG